MPDGKQKYNYDTSEKWSLDSAIQNKQSQAESQVIPEEFRKANEANNQRIAKLRQSYNLGEGLPGGQGQLQQQVDFSASPEGQSLMQLGKMAYQPIQQAIKGSSQILPNLIKGNINKAGGNALDMVEGGFGTLMLPASIPSNIAASSLENIPAIQKFDQSDISKRINYLLTSPAEDIGRLGGKLITGKDGKIPEDLSRVGNLITNLILMKGLDNLKSPNFEPLTKLSPERISELKNENQNQTSGGVPSEQGKPINEPATGQAETGTSQRESQGQKQQGETTQTSRLDEHFKDTLKRSGVQADYKGMNKNKGAVTGITIDAVVDPGNPNPALRKTSITIPPTDFTPENIRKAVEDKIEEFKQKVATDTGTPQGSTIDKQAIISSLEPQRKELEAKYGSKLEDLSPTELQNLQKQISAVKKQPYEMTKEEFNKERPSVPGYRFHGSPEGDISNPDVYYHTKNWQEGLGFYTTENRDMAQKYAEGKTAGVDRQKGIGRINYVKGEPKNPLNMDAPIDRNLWNDVAKKMSLIDKNGNYDLSEVKTNKDAYRQLIRDYNDENATGEGQYAVEEILGNYDTYQYTEGIKSGHPHKVTIWRSEFNPPEIVKPEDVHKQTIEQALKEGKTVPAEVLKDYPDLEKKYNSQSSNKSLQPPENPEQPFEQVKPLSQSIENKPGNYYEDPTEINTETPNIAGISERVRDARSNISGIPASETGIGWSAQESLERGNYLRENGASANSVIEDFNKDKSISADGMAIVRSELSDLQKAENRAADDYGINSKEHQDAQAKTKQLEDASKPMQTEWSKIGFGQQGYEDIDFDSPTGQVKYFDSANKNKPDEFETKKLKYYADENKKLTDYNESLKAKLQDAINKHLDKSKDNIKGSIKLSSKELADKIRRNAKIHRPGAFYSATPASLAWDLGVEAVAQVIEKGGALAEAIKSGVEKIKDTDWYKSLSKDKQIETESQFKQWHQNQSKIKIDLNSLKEAFAGKKDNNFTNAEVNAIWQYAKSNYIDNGKIAYQNIVKNLSQDLGLSVEQIQKALNEPKIIKEITDEQYRTQYKRRMFQKQNKAWIDSRNTPGWYRFISSLPNRFFGWYVLGHGTVFGQTHAGMELFRPSVWKNYFPALIRQFKYSYGDPAIYEKAMENLQSDPNYIIAKKAGLANDPNRIYDDYMLTDKYFGKLGQIGERGFNSWKIYRQEMFNKEWNSLSDAAKADPNSAKVIADIVNHSTGTTTTNFPKWVNTAFFAPHLEASRWERLFGEPALMVKNYINWGLGKLTDKEISPSEKLQAKLIFKRNGEMIATVATLLAANEGINLLTGSKQHINFTNPEKSDWLRFKAGGQIIDWSGGVFSTMTLTARLLEAAIGNEKTVNKYSRGKGRGNLMIENTGNYIKGKFAPFTGTGFAFATHHDYSGNTLPPFKDKPLFKDAKHLSWSQYILSEQMPIPISEGIKDIYDSMAMKGMTKPQIEDILNGIFISLVAGGTGARVREEYKNEYKQGNKSSQTKGSKKIRIITR